MLTSDILQSSEYESSLELCQGCDNHCTVRAFKFTNGKTFYSGNNCERIYSNSTESAVKGVNMFAEKRRRLFSYAARKPQPTDRQLPTIGIPRGLGIYENYPFWKTLFDESGVPTRLSHNSSNTLYEKGIRTIVADNICFPAKLFHGHVMDLVEQGVDRIFYPWVVFEKKEDANSKNSFNCPIVSGYSDVIGSSINTAATYGIPFDAPVISFKEESLLISSCTQYLCSLGVDKHVATEATRKAIAAQEEYLEWLTRRAEEVLREAQAASRMVILLAARPYHIDPLIEHKISSAIADMGIDVITENVARRAGAEVYEHINALCQWAYPNRIFKAAHFVARHSYRQLHLVELTSFGCGPDAFILDEVRLILNRYGKNLTILKIDDVNNIGSLKLRVRSLVESASQAAATADDSAPVASDKPWTTRAFEEGDRDFTIIAPFFAEGYTDYIPVALRMAGYKVVPLPMGCQADAEEGLRVANNDVCYPATIVIGSIMRALKSGKYDLRHTAVAITQTGGQCRASNYYSLIKNAMVRAGYSDIPVISVATGAGLKNTQPGFSIDWKKMLLPVAVTLYYADALQKLYYPSVVREKQPGKAKELLHKYTELSFPLVEKRQYRKMLSLLGQAAHEFAENIERKEVPLVGVVGEIYVKYNSFSNKNVVQWLIDKGVEVVPPAITGFFSTALVNNHINRELNIRTDNPPLWATGALHRLLNYIAHRCDRACNAFPYYRPFTDIFDNARLSRKVINPAADFGEGWFLPGEICHLAESGVNKIVSLQPFGCIANHIISKGIEKRIKDTYPELSLLFLDFDSGTSEANVQNRLHFMLAQ